MIGYCPLASSSSGNSVFFGSEQCKVLIDCGLSGKKTKEKLAEINIDIEEIDAILITHEHIDHIRALKVLAMKHNIPVIANRETARGIIDTLKATPQFKLFTTGESFQFQDIEIHPFTIAHDALDPVGFTLETSGLKFGFCTDLGYVTSVVQNRLEGSDYLYLEANHEPSMVHACARPPIYKQRVLGRTGHLSNEGCGNLLKDLNHSGLRHAHLAHLSSECNSPEMALKRVREVSETNVPLTCVSPHVVGKPILPKEHLVTY
jgi:phosphoribosyl 1,2-cyclic phosphodiesterase